MFFRAFEDGGVIDGIKSEGAGQIFGEAGVGRVGLNEFKGDGVADRLMAGGGLAAGGHDLISLAARGRCWPDAGVLPLGCGFPGPGKAGGEKGAASGWSSVALAKPNQRREDQPDAAGPEPRAARLRASMARTHPFVETGA